MDNKLILTAAFILLMPFASYADDLKAGASPLNGFQATDLKFLSDSEKQQWLEDMRVKLPITKRKRGPFGLPQKIQKRTIKQSQKRAVKPEDFSKAIAQIKVNAVLPAERKFIIGAREFRVGQVLPIIYGTQKFNVKIVSVNKGVIQFKDTRTGKLARHDINAMAKGVMNPDNKIQRMPNGVAPKKRGMAPLDLNQ